MSLKHAGSNHWFRETEDLIFQEWICATSQLLYSIKMMSKWESNAGTKKQGIASWYSAFVNPSCAWPKHMGKRSELVTDSAHEAPHGAEPISIKLSLSVHNIAQTDIIIHFILDD